MKMTIILAFLALILFALFYGLFAMLSDKGKGDKTVKALTIRVALSFALILFLLLSYLAGWISPHPAFPPPPTSAQDQTTKEGG